MCTVFLLIYITYFCCIVVICFVFGRHGGPSVCCTNCVKYHILNTHSHYMGRTLAIRTLRTRGGAWINCWDLKVNPCHSGGWTYQTSRSRAHMWEASYLNLLTGDLESWLRIFLALLNPINKIVGLYLKLGHGHFRITPLQFIIHWLTNYPALRNRSYWQRS